MTWTPEAIYLAKILCIGGVFLGLFCLERLARATPETTGPGRLVRNGGLWLMTVIASPALIVPLTAFGANHLLWSRDPFTEQIGFAVAFLLVDLIVLDLWTYWLHRAYHRVPILWRFHEVHHRDRHLDTTSAFRFHVGEVVISASLRLAPIMIFAIPLQHVIIYEAIMLSVAIFHHSNLRIPGRIEAALSRIIVTPSIHWVHHHARRTDTDSNYAAVLSAWDKVFGTRSQTQRTRDMTIGAEGVEELTFIGLLLSPFVRKP